MKALTLAPNTAPVSEKSTEPTERPQFACPLTMKEMNGAQPFVYLKTCGCVFSQAGLKTLTESGTASPKEGEVEEANTKQLDVCPQCATKYDKSFDVLLLNPSPTDEEQMFAAMILRRASEPSKKSKKRKVVPSDPSSDTTVPPSKSKKPNNTKSNSSQPHTNPSISAASRAVVSSLAKEEAKRKAGMSEAVKSLYGTGEKRKETFMTMGTFTRVSVLIELLR